MKITSDAEYAMVRIVIDALIRQDPQADTDMGKALVYFAHLALDYERGRWPIDPPTPEEAAAFRREQEQGA